MRLEAFTNGEAMCLQHELQKNTLIQRVQAIASWGSGIILPFENNLYNEN